MPQLNSALYHLKLERTGQLREREWIVEQPAVKLYALSTCGHCRSTKKALVEMGVAYDCVEVDTLTGQERTDTIEEVKKVNPNLSFPTLVIGETVIVGHKEQAIKDALGL